MEFGDREVLAGALAALTYVSRGLLDYATRRADREATLSPAALRALLQDSRDVGPRLAQIQQALGGVAKHAARTEALHEALRGLDGKVGELLRMHRDPTSGFATADTNRLLHAVLQALSRIEGQLGVPKR